MREKAKEGKKLEIRPYNNSLEHILDLLSRLDLVLAIRIIKFQKLHYRPYKQNYGLVITNEEVNAALNINTTTSDLNNAVEDNDAGSQIATIRVRLDEKEKEIAAKVTETLRQGIYLSLPHLIHIFELRQIEVDAILICLATQIDNEISKKYQKIYAYLNDNILQKKPTVDLVLWLIYESLSDRIVARTMMSKDTHLFRYRILEFVENESNYDVSDRPIRIDEQIVNFLLGSRIFEPRISPFAKLTDTSKFKQEITYHHQDIINDIASLLLRVKEYDEHNRDGSSSSSSIIANNNGDSDRNRVANSKIILNLFGPRGSGRKTAATIICRNFQYPLLSIDLAEVLSRGLPLEEYLLLAFREALLSRAATYLENFDVLLDKNEKSYSAIKTILRMIDELSWLTFIETTPSSWNHGGSLNSYVFRTIEFKIPSYNGRKRIWDSIVDYEVNTSNFRLEKNVDFGILASKFPFTPGRIRDSFQVAKNLAISRNDTRDGVNIITINDLYQGCKMQSNVGLGMMAKKIEPNYGWADIVLPPAIMALLKDICNVVKNKGTVYYEWGFDAKFSLGKGLTALFTGESGTGKTMAAEVISKDLDLDLYKIDISSILSKYIGETEKNLNTIFRESEGSNSILFFDEADALFGKRTEVKDSHDRYANIETNYLLQKIDEFDGIVILSSNFRRNIDESFLRRMQFIVNFPFPDAHYRLEIWNKAFPHQVPRRNDLDLKFLADNLQISGGNIKNVVVNSAFLAAEKSERISMSHIVLSIKREFEKMGRPIQRSDFGKYSVLLDPSPFAT